MTSFGNNSLLIYGAHVPSAWHISASHVPCVVPSPGIPVPSFVVRQPQEPSDRQIVPASGQLPCAVLSPGTPVPSFALRHPHVPSGRHNWSAFGHVPWPVHQFYSVSNEHVVSILYLRFPISFDTKGCLKSIFWEKRFTLDSKVILYLEKYCFLGNLIQI